MYIKLLAILIILITSPANAEIVVRVIDGDTLKVAGANGLTTVRLYGIDAPEKKQMHGMRARQFVEFLVANKDIKVTPVDTDRYGRTVAIVMIGEQCLQEQLLVSGLAWVYPQYCKKRFCTAWTSLQRIASVNKCGLWADPIPVQPWVWRKQQR